MLKVPDVDPKVVAAKIAGEPMAKPPTEINEIVKRAILRIQANARGIQVRKAMREKQLMVEQAKAENDRLFAKEFATISMEIENAANLDKRLADLMGKLPSTVQKLVVGYEYRCYWFEIFECIRKLALVCLPQLMDPRKPVDRTVLTLIISFLTFSTYVGFSPYEDHSNDELSIICQMIIFFVLLSEIVTLCSTESSFVDTLLPVCILVPLLYFAFVKTGLASLWKRWRKKCVRPSDKKDPDSFTKRMIRIIDQWLGTPVKFATATMTPPSATTKTKSTNKVEPTTTTTTTTTTTSSQSSAVVESASELKEAISVAAPSAAPPAAPVAAQADALADAPAHAPADALPPAAALPAMNSEGGTAAASSDEHNQATLTPSAPAAPAALEA